MDLTAIVNATRRVPAADLRATGDRLAVTLRMLVPLVESVGSMPELARELAAHSAADTLALILPAGSGQARIDLGQRQTAIPAALRDAILTALEQSNARTVAPAVSAPDSGAAARATVAVDPAATVRLIDASAQASALVAATARTIARATPPTASRSAPAAQATFSHPLLDAQSDAASIAVRLRDLLQRSGPLREAQLTAPMPETRPGTVSDAGRDDVHVKPASSVATQPDVLTREAVLLQGPAWSGQMATIELRREACIDAYVHHAAGEADRVAFSARLKLDLPRLGMLEVHLRVVGTTVAVGVESVQHAVIERELPELDAHLAARGLQPAWLQAAAPR